MPSRTLQSAGSPSQPSRFFPLNSGLKPSAASAAAEHTSVASSNFFIDSAPFDGDGADLDILVRTVLRVARDLGDLLDNVVALDYFPENCVLVIEERCGSDGDEKLA